MCQIRAGAFKVRARCRPGPGVTEFDAGEVCVFYDGDSVAIGRLGAHRARTCPSPSGSGIASMSVNGPVAIILAAGQGKRMKSEKAKVLHEVCGRPMIHYVVDAARGAGPGPSSSWSVMRPTRFSNPCSESPTSSSQPSPTSLEPAMPSRFAARSWPTIEGPAMVLVGDEPLLRPEPLADLLARQEHEGAACLLGTAKVHDAMGFGRILRDSAGRFLRIVEERDCTPEEKAIREVNPSCYVFELPALWEALDQIGTSNAQHEYYLTDAPERLMAMGQKVMALNVLRADDILGVNTRQHLAHAASVMQARIQDHWMTEGVTIVDPHNTYIDGRAEIGRDTVDLPVQRDLRSGQDRRRLPGRTVHPPPRRHRARGRRRGRRLRRGQPLAHRDRHRSPAISPTWVTPSWVEM